MTSLEAFTEADPVTVKLLINDEICFEKGCKGKTVRYERFARLFF